MTELDKNKRDLDCIYDFAVEYCDLVDELSPSDTIRYNYDRLLQFLKKHNELTSEIKAIILTKHISEEDKLKRIEELIESE